MTYKRTLAHGASQLAAAFVLAGLGLAGCNQNASNAASANTAPPPLAALPMTNDVVPPSAPAPAATALPPAPPARVGYVSNPGDRYAFADRAYAMNSGFGNAPPDYTFQYAGGERPWVWRGNDQSTRVAEPLPGGGFRYYYYEPGASQPYLVRDPTYSYGYNGGALAVVYDSQGRPVPPDMMQRQADIAGRFLYRAAAIYAATQQQQHEAVAEANWAAQRNAVDSERAQWEADQSANQDWAAYHAAHQQEEDAHWAAESYQRASEAVRFDITINDNQAAQRDNQAVQQAQVRAAAVGQPVGPSRPAYAPAPAAPAAPIAAPPPPRAFQPVGAPGAPPVRPGPAVAPAVPGESPAAQAAAARRVAAQNAAAQAAQAAAARRAASQNAAAQAAQAAAARRAAGQNAAAQAAQAAAARRAAAQSAAAQAKANQQAKLAAEQAARRSRLAAPVVRPVVKPVVKAPVRAPKAATVTEPKPAHPKKPGEDDRRPPEHP